jgi:hypothetical protein
VLEGLGATPGDETRRLYFVDDDNRLFTRDLNQADAPQALAANDVGDLRQIALDGGGRLFALAARGDEAPRLHQLEARDDGQHEWVAQALTLAPGHALAAIESTWTGRLQLTTAPPGGEDAAAGPSIYHYAPGTGLAPLDRQGAIDALRASGGREFHLPGLPDAHVRAEFLGFKSTSRPFLSTPSTGSSRPGRTRARWLRRPRSARAGCSTSATGAGLAAAVPGHQRQPAGTASISPRARPNPPPPGWPPRSRSWARQRPSWPATCRPSPTS